MKRPENFVKTYSTICFETKCSAIKCHVCNKIIKSKSGFGTHLLSHNLNWDEYVFKYFKLLNPDFKYETCGFCNKQALPNIFVNIQKNTYYLKYSNGFMCKTAECINQICLDFFNKPYEQAKHQYEHIGSKTLFLVKKYKTTEDDIKINKKGNPNYKISDSSKVTLTGYITRYGEKIGTQKYYERNQKISKAQTIEWYIQKYGIDVGVQKFQNKREKSYEATKNITHSKKTILFIL